MNNYQIGEQSILQVGRLVMICFSLPLASPSFHYPSK